MSSDEEEQEQQQVVMRKMSKEQQQQQGGKSENQKEYHENNKYNPQYARPRGGYNQNQNQNFHQNRHGQHRELLNKIESATTNVELVIYKLPNNVPDDQVITIIQKQFPNISFKSLSVYQQGALLAEFHSNKDAFAFAQNTQQHLIMGRAIQLKLAQEWNQNGSNYRTNQQSNYQQRPNNQQNQQMQQGNKYVDKPKRHNNNYQTDRKVYSESQFYQPNFNENTNIQRSQIKQSAAPNVQEQKIDNTQQEYKPIGFIKAKQAQKQPSSEQQTQDKVIKPNPFGNAKPRDELPFMQKLEIQDQPQIHITSAKTQQEGEKKLKEQNEQKQAVVDEEIQKVSTVNEFKVVGSVHQTRKGQNQINIQQNQEASSKKQKNQGKISNSKKGKQTVEYQVKIETDAPSLAQTSLMTSNNQQQKLSTQTEQLNTPVQQISATMKKSKPKSKEQKNLPHKNIFEILGFDEEEADDDNS